MNIPRESSGGGPRLYWLSAMVVPPDLVETVAMALEFTRKHWPRLNGGADVTPELDAAAEFALKERRRLLHAYAAYVAADVADQPTFVDGSGLDHPRGSLTPNEVGLMLGITGAGVRYWARSLSLGRCRTPEGWFFDEAAVEEIQRAREARQ